VLILDFFIAIIDMNDYLMMRRVLYMLNDERKRTERDDVGER